MAYSELPFKNYIEASLSNPGFTDNYMQFNDRSQLENIDSENTSTK